MNVKFRVLWFEDNPNWLKIEKENVEDLLREHCLIPEIDCFDGEEIDAERITDRQYDLILMDYMLAEEKTGDAVARIIRSHKVLTDILFYSSNTDKMHAAIQDAIPELDGIYITKRDTKTFKDKVTGIIEKIIKRSEDIVNLRGFVLDNTSDFETRITQMLILCYKKFAIEDKKLLDADMAKRILDSLEVKKKKFDSINGSEAFFDNACKEHTLTDISTKLKVLQKVISILKSKYVMSDDLCSNSFLEYYMSNVGTYRNQLGHTKADDSEIIIKGNAEKIDEKLHQKMRQNITEVDKTLRRLEQHVSKISSADNP